MLISLAFQRYVERPKRRPYVAWASVFVRPAPAVRTGLANKSDFIVEWALNSIFAWALVICVLVMSSSTRHHPRRSPAHGRRHGKKQRERNGDGGDGSLVIRSK